MATELLIALLAGDTIVAGTLSSVVTWLLSRKKYNSEVDQSNIKNMQESLDFYIKIADDYKVRLASEIESHNREVEEIKRESSAQIAELKAENAALKKELREQEKKFDSMLMAQQREISLMKNQMLSVYSQVCLNFNCMERTAARQLSSAKSRTNKKIKKANNNETTTEETVQKD